MDETTFQECFARFHLAQLTFPWFYAMTGRKLLQLVIFKC